jgi:hypothetical protein
MYFFSVAISTLTTAAAAAAAAALTRVYFTSTAFI